MELLVLPKNVKPQKINVLLVLLITLFQLIKLVLEPKLNIVKNMIPLMPINVKLVLIMLKLQLLMEPVNVNQDS